MTTSKEFTLTSEAIQQRQQYPRAGARLFALAEHGPLYDQHSPLNCLCQKCKTHVKQLPQTDNFRQIFEKGSFFHETAAPVWLCKDCALHCKTTQHLKGGFKGNHLVTELAMNTMEEDIIRQDILEAFHMKNRLPFNDQVQFLSALPGDKTRGFEISKLQLEDLTAFAIEETQTKRRLAQQMLASSSTEALPHLESTPEAKESEVDFHVFRKLVFRLRKEYVQSQKQMFPALTASNSSLSSTIKTRHTSRKSVDDSDPFATAGHSSLLSISMLKNPVPETQSSSLLSRLQHARLHKISHLSQQNDSKLSQNVFLMRDYEDDKIMGWDACAAIRQTGPPSFVKKQTAPNDQV